MDFTPDNQEAQEVPFFKDATAAGGWAGYTSRKSLEKIQSEIKEVIDLLGGTVTGFMKGTFAGDHPRDGYEVHYIMKSPGGLVNGKMEIAALPVEKPSYMGGRGLATYKKQRGESLKMALYMLRDSLKGMWYLQQLSPGFAALMPFMIANDSGETISQLWSKQATFANLLPPGDAKFEEEIIEGEYTEAN